MKNIIEYAKDKIYYIMGITIVIIIILIIISSCSSKKIRSYSSIEEDMQYAAEKYYSTRENRLPKTNGGTVKVTLSTLIDAGLMDEVTDPKNSKNTCSGYVIVTKVSKEYTYTPFLSCKDNYEPKYLLDIVKSSSIDEYGNGVYLKNGEYIYKGKDVRNYVEFNDKLWRIIKVDTSGDIKLVLVSKTDEYYLWDSAYNSVENEKSGITTNYTNTDIRRALKSYYKTFSKEAKSVIVAKNICIGGYDITDDSYNYVGPAPSIEKECSAIKENEYVGLLNVSDYINASTDENCTTILNKSCNNYNYLNNEEINTWTLNRVTNSTSKVFYIDEEIDYKKAYNNKKINPVIYVKNVIISEGKGTSTNPYVLK